MKKVMFLFLLLSLATNVFADVLPYPYLPDVLDLSAVVMLMLGIFIVALIALIYILLKRRKK